MQLTRFSDYSLRLVLYLAAHPARRVPVQEVSRAYGVSHHHMVKVVQRLVKRRIVVSSRGRQGGLRLNQPPERISVGGLVRMTEPDFDLVECFKRSTNRCPLDRACGLKGVLTRANGAFLSVLDEYTIADFAPRAPELIQLWKREASRRT